MIISDEHRFIFIKSRKKAGSSIQAALAEVCGPRDIITGGRVEISRNCWDNRREYIALRAKTLLQGHIFWPISRFHSLHATIKMVTEVLCEQAKAYFKFAFVRNPFDLVVSRYIWDKSLQRHAYNDLQPWLEEQYMPRRQWEKDLLHRHTHVDGVCRLDYVGRFERLSEDFRYVCGTLDLVEMELPRKKSGFRSSRQYQDHYSPASRSLVEQLFAEDLRIFGYAFA